MKIGIGFIAYNTGGYTTKQFDSILSHSSHEIVPMLFLHNNRHQELIDECGSIIKKYPQTIYLPYGANRGCAKSGNEAMYLSYHKYHCDIYMGIAQDVWFNNPNSFDNWIENCKPYMDTKFAISAKTDTSPYTCILLTKLCNEKMGYLDENFFPSQYEDVDFHHRCSLIMSGHYEPFWNNSHRIDIASDTTHIGLLSRRDGQLLQQQLYITAPLCQRYYIRKWGGIEGQEKFIYPFNNPELPNNIIWEKHSNPYGPGYDRTDQHIVVY